MSGFGAQMRLPWLGEWTCRRWRMMSTPPSAIDEALALWDPFLTAVTAKRRRASPGVVRSHRMAAAVAVSPLGASGGRGIPAAVSEGNTEVACSQLLSRQRPEQRKDLMHTLHTHRRRGRQAAIAAAISSQRVANTRQEAVRPHNNTSKERQMGPRSRTQVGKWVRRSVVSALVLALAGLSAPATTTARAMEDGGGRGDHH